FACGTPVIASRIGAMQEMVEEGVNGAFFAPGDAEALAGAVERLFQAPSARRAEMRKAARQAYERHYTAEAGYDRLLDIYRQAVSKG
ncbi:MAG: glycosyltransferase family 4 protein, partial [Chloroflexi bacterium]|nr:glycosyltransferase family 4 protein [Chloroflexota bacterium]